jgi:superfamily II DNA or RNA helicase
MDAHFILKDSLNIQINTNNRDYIDGVKEFLTDFVKDYRFMPKYKKGGWNGKISLFNRPTRSFPYGLLFEVIKYTKREWPDLDIVISKDVKDLFNGIDISKMEYDLSLYPYDYQKECISTLLKASKGICVVATAGGKSLIITYLIHGIKQFHPDSKALIIVPTKQLVQQFRDDIIGYYEDDIISIGIVDSDHKEFDRDIVISTWQSLQNQPDELQHFNALIVDEVHTAQADVLLGILKNCENAKFRFGVTGTLPVNRLDKLNVLSYLGPVFKTYTGKDLADLGYVSQCVIKQIHINYENKYTGKYNDIKDLVFHNPFRINLIKYIIKNRDNSILILVDKIEKEGEPLYKILKESFPDKKVIFLSGKDKSSTRDEWRKKMHTDNDIVCIATYPIFQQGVNIPSLRTIILSSSTKSFIRVIQSLGRILRKHVSKELGGAELFDICDNVRYLKDHAQRRERHYIKEKHDIEVIELNEKDGRYII